MKQSLVLMMLVAMGTVALADEAGKKPVLTVEQMAADRVIAQNQAIIERMYPDLKDRHSAFAKAYQAEYVALVEGDSPMSRLADFEQLLAAKVASRLGILPQGVTAVQTSAASESLIPAPVAKAPEKLILPEGWITPAKKEEQRKEQELKEKQEQMEHERMLANIDRRASEAAAARAAEEARAQAANTPTTSVPYYPPMTQQMARAMSYYKPDTAESLRAKEEQRQEMLETEQRQVLQDIRNELIWARMQGR